MTEISNTAKDPVCGMLVNKTETPYSMEYQGQTYFFCCEECQRKFETVPAEFLLNEVA